MAVIGVADVLVRPSFKDFQREVGKEIDGAANSQQVKGAGSRLGGLLKGAAVAGVAGAGVALGTALTKGFGRLTAIENARAKLSGLGNDAATVEAIMTNALDAVKGTAFGMDEAATVAAQVVASGIKPGKELEGVLRLVGDAATIAGTDMSSMGAVFGKVAASGKIQGDTIAQLADMGIPIVQMLAKELGTSAEETYKLASEGKINFETFRAAMEDGLGGAAAKSGETLQGAMKNAMAAVGRFGANLMEGVYPKVREFFNLFQEWMGPVEEMGKAIGERLGAALEDLGDWITRDALPALKDFGDWVRDNREPIALVAAAIGGMMAGFALYQGVQGAIGWLEGIASAIGLLNAAMAANPIGLVVVALGALVGAAIWAYNNVEWFRDGVDEAFRVIGEVATNVWQNFLRPAFENISAFVRDKLGPAINWLYEEVVKPVMGFIGTTVKDAWELVIRPALDAFWRFVRDDLGPVLQSLWTNFVEPVFKDVQKIITDMWKAVEPVLGDFKSFIETELAPTFTKLTENYVRPAMATIGTLIQGRMNSSAQQMGGLKNFMDNQLGPAFNVARVKARHGMEGIGSAIGGLWNWARPILGKFEKGITHALVTNTVNAVASFARTWETLKRTFQTPVNWVINNVLNPLIDAFNRISGAVNGPTIKRLVGYDAHQVGKGNSAGTGGVTTVGRRAAGGNVHAGKPYLVGELGPELIYPDRDGYVATARETAKMMAAGKDLPEDLAKRAAGRSPSEALAPMGDGMGGLIGRGVEWLVGELAGNVRKLIDPALSAMSSALSGYGPMGQMTGAAARKAVDAVLGFAKTKDASFMGGMSGAIHEGPLGSFYKPSSGIITSRYGPRWGRLHEGIDIAAGAAGAAIKAAWNGVVAKTGWNIGPGRTGIGALLNHGSRWSYYGHMRPGSLAVRPGQKVKAGQQIGWQGTTGNSTGVHLHFEEHRGRAWNSVNPGYLFRDNGGRLPPGLSTVLNNTGGYEHVFNQRQIGALEDAVTGGGALDYDRLADVLADRLDGLSVQMDGRKTIGALRSNRAWAGAS